MPIYEFQCDACGHQFEKLQKINAEFPVCPVCNKSDVRKLVSSASFHLKGSGWYKSDYKKPDDKNKTKQSYADNSKENKKESSSSGDSGKTTKSETKADVTNKSAVKDAA